MGEYYPFSMATLPTHMHGVLSAVLGTWINVQLSFDLKKNPCEVLVYILKADITVCAYEFIFCDRYV